MRRPAFIAANLCVVTGLGIIGYAILGSYTQEALQPGCPDGMALTAGASGRNVCIRGVTLSTDSDPKCPEGHVALDGVSGRTICTPGIEAPAGQPG